ncbi:hypothetical protein ABZP36_029499 [Zizania latifolia]
MPAASSSMTSLDEYDAHSFFFPAADDFCGSQVETLEAVLRQPVTVASPAAAAVVEERELEPAAGESGRACSSVSVAAAPRRRPFRTDRHSKIRTAQGVRDRRMRLSVGVARDFFALQDKLGFDKASKTVDWLLTQSKPAIDHLSLADAAAPGDSDAAVPPPEPSASAASAKEKGEASSSSTSAGTKDDASEKAKAKAPARAREMSTEKQVIQARSRGVGSSASPVALMDEHAWSVSTPAETTTIEQWPMDGLEYYYHYHNHLEEMI